MSVRRAWCCAALTNSQVSEVTKVDPSARTAAREETGRATDPDNKTAGQDALPAGSRIATHSTCDAIGNMSHEAGTAIIAGQCGYAARSGRLLGAWSVQRASRREYRPGRISQATAP